MKVKVGEHIRGTGESAFYAGMISKDVFSLGVTFNTGPLLFDSGYNIFYPKNTKKININGTSFKLISVTPEVIDLKKINK